MQRAESGRADLGLARAAFRNDERRSLSVKLPFDGLRYCELRVIKGIACVLYDVVIDGQHFVGKGLASRIEEGHELIADAVCHGHAEGIEIPSDIVHAVKSVRSAGNSAGDLDISGSQSFLQHFYDVFILRLQIQHPCVDPLCLRNDLQLSEIPVALKR